MEIKNVPTRENILSIMKDAGTPLSFRNIARQLDITPNVEKPLKYRIKAMVRDGQLLCNRRNKYGLVQSMDLIKGVVVGRSDGTGYLETDTIKSLKRLFISSREMRKVLHGDEVIAYVSQKSGDKNEVAIAEILKRNTTDIVGTVYKEQGITFLQPSAVHFSQDVIIVNASRKHTGSLVQVKLTHQPTEHSPPIGNITEIIGKADDPIHEVEIALRSYAIPSEWSAGALKQSEAIKEQIPSKELKERLDLRNLALITIDGEDAKDFDDAVYAEKLKDGWRLIVAIADVSHYIKQGSALDKEAHKRGNSVYFPNKVIPMLPESLSNGVCSLKPNVERLCIACDMHINKDGEIVNFSLHNSIMLSKARLTYNSVWEMIENKNHKLWSENAEVSKNIEQLDALYRQLIKQRRKRGALEISSSQVTMEFGETGAIKKINPYESNDAHRIIEECMLLANCCAAEYLRRHNVPLLYRIHEPPASEKIVLLRQTLIALNLTLGGGNNPQPQHFCKLINEAKSLPQSAMVQMAVLQTFKQAIYSPQNLGHFGLNFNEYAHFTSPIRRYPDLLVHRAIKSTLQTKTVTSIANNEEALEKIGQHCSRTERRADSATRDVTLVLKCHFAKQHVGESFSGSITGVRAFGFFVLIDELGLDGLVHVSNLKSDYYHFDEIHHQLKGEHLGNTFSIGDRIKIKLNQINIGERKIDLLPIDTSDQKRATKT